MRKRMEKRVINTGKREVRAGGGLRLSGRPTGPAEAGDDAVSLQ